jgi:GntR family transcriptional regulator
MSDILQLPELTARVGSPPLPELVAASLRQAVVAGQLEPGQRLPSEPDLAGQLGVSRATLRHALSILEQEGLLVRQHGLGTFVSAVPPSLLRGGLAELSSTTDLIRSQGYEPGAVGLRIQQRTVARSIAEPFGLGPHDAFLHISRTRTANGRPVIHCEEYVPAGLLPVELLPTDTEASGWSLYESLASAGSGPMLASCVVVPVVAGDDIATRLRLEPGHPLLLMKQWHYTQAGRPVLYCENWHNSGLLEFQIIRRA